ncbi:hypothetical protein SAMN05216249_1096 [Acetitomaculum ruminis DSM 5522]|uniref:Serine aminopeptidase S33 domain-containing protein n=1 Tax=Acetitomaculum ruminis DSM 5522 TaxID=1120918 RepID=A0A1I0Y8S8_9FIRM|nr:alpha/beta fold hydrolase [Acetitomaculum ruminis]SFB09207.1 hypothetical protein SAMN05216249_1096 [Acetitomaculum ruminis DSM 5522]
MKKRKRKILIIISSLLLLLVVGWGIFCVRIYDENINIRCETYDLTKLRVEDFDGLNCKEYSFPSDKGQMLAGYLYSAGEHQRGIVIIAHGFGGGHNSYMDCANYFAQNGYFVFAYDATASDKSEGDGIGCTPQGVVDLDKAISYIESNEDIPDLPIVLFGHSWGAYSAYNVLTYHPEIKAVIGGAGFNKSSDMFESFGKKSVGNIIYALMPFVKLHEFVHYGKYAVNTALDAFEASDAQVMVVHSTDDDIIMTEYGYDLFYDKYKDNPRFKFVKFKDRGHNKLFFDPDNTYVDEFNEQYQNWRANLDYDTDAKENHDRFIKDEAKYYKEHLDRSKYCNRLEKKLFKKFLNFYDEAIK